MQPLAVRASIGNTIFPIRLDARTMSDITSNHSTYWTMIENAARGSHEDRSQFADIYLPIVRAYLLSRWKSTSRIGIAEDATQEVFVECFREGGALSKADRERRGGFRAFLFGITRNVARRFESSRKATNSVAEPEVLETVPSTDASASIQFDRVWAMAMMQRAAALQEVRAADLGEAARKRVELLRMRFQDGVPIRKIAEQWQVDSTKLHHEYAKARREFQSALFEVVHRHGTGSEADARRECELLLDILG